MESHHGETQPPNTSPKSSPTKSHSENYDQNFFFQKRLSPIHRQLNFLNLNSIFELEVIKFVYKFKKKTHPILFYNYFQSASQTHSYPTRFAVDLNLTVMLCKKTSTQRSICYEGYKIWNKLPIKVKSNYTGQQKKIFFKRQKMLDRFWVNRGC